VLARLLRLAHHVIFMGRFVGHRAHRATALIHNPGVLPYLQAAIESKVPGHVCVRNTGSEAPG